MEFTYSKGLFTGKVIDGNIVVIYREDGVETLRASNNVTSGMPWDEDTAKLFIKEETEFRNFGIVKTLVTSKLNKLTTVYDEYMNSNVTLSDGNVFGASKMPNSEIKNLQNTVDLIESGCKLSIYKEKDSIIVSDAFNNDIEYEFDYDTVKPEYILPVIEIATYISAYFNVKRIIRNKINSYLDTSLEEINLDELYELDIEDLFKTMVDSVISDS